MDNRLRRLEHPFAAGWFVAGLYLFGIGIAASTGTIALALVPQMQAIGAITLLCAVFGALVCLLGVRLYHPLRWRALQAHLASLGESLSDANEALAKPRGAYAGDD
jgi:formate hydrogenlyase subunit 4